MLGTRHHSPCLSGPISCYPPATQAKLADPSPGPTLSQDLGTCCSVRGPHDWTPTTLCPLIKHRLFSDTGPNTRPPYPLTSLLCFSPLHFIRSRPDSPLILKHMQGCKLHQEWGFCLSCLYAPSSPKSPAGPKWLSPKRFREERSSPCSQESHSVMATSPFRVWRLRHGPASRWRWVDTLCV